MAQPALLIDCHKIITWLQQRKKLPKDWYNYEKAAEQKIKFLLKDQQQYENSGNQNIIPYIKQHIQNFHYGNVVHLVNQLLKTKWAQNKSLVFGYSDKRVKEWTNLKKFMENKQINIVNMGKFLNQGLTFDLPSLDKNVELLDNQMTNLKRKIDFNTNTIYQQEKQSNNQKSKLGLKTNANINISEQIPNLIKQVPQLFASLESKVKGISKCYNIYVKYCEETEIKQCNKLQILQNFIQHGNNYIANIAKYRINSEQQQSQSNNFTKQQKYNSYYNWKPHNEWGIQIQAANSNNSNKNEQKLQTILQSRTSRIQLIQDLNQLLYFYHGVKYEQGLKSNITTLQSENAVINLVQSQILQIIKSIQNILAMINGDIATRVQLKKSAKAYQILLRKFRNYEQNIQYINKQNQQYQKQIQQMKVKREDIVKDLRKLRVKLVQSKNQCEKYLTDLIKRQIRITGEINKLQ